MINFFRRTRRKLAANNQFFQYSRYAIGEIVLVVIGILIALSVSNYNEFLKDKNNEAAYLEGIRADLQKQILDFNKSMSSNAQRVEIINTILDNHVSQNGFKRNDSILVMFNKIISVSLPTETKTTFTELLYSGDLNVIRNEKLKNEIVRFYQDLERMVQGSTSNITNVYQNHLLLMLTSRTIVGNQGTYSHHTGDLNDKIHTRNYSQQFKDLAFDKLEDPKRELELVNALNLKAIIEVLQNNRSKVIVESAEELIDRIESELRNRHNIDL